MNRGPYDPPEWEANLFGLLCVAVMIGVSVVFKLISRWLTPPRFAAVAHKHHLTDEELAEMRTAHPHVFITPMATAAFIRANRPGVDLSGAIQDFEVFAAATPPGKKAVFIVDLGAP